MTELEAIPGTGNEGRVTKKDILQYVSDKKVREIHESELRSSEPGTADHKPAGSGGNKGTLHKQSSAH